MPVDSGRLGARDPISLGKALIEAIRPKQAPKNLFVYGALVFVGKLFDLRLFGRVTLAFVLFTLVAGSVYLLNDILDIDQDRRHPKKKNRPIASGRLPIPIAWVAFAVFALGGLIASFALRMPFGVAVLAYLILQIAYCFRLKHIVLLDVFAVACGFVLRTVAGALVIGVTISPWLLLCSLQLALFLGFGKRRQELVQLGQGSGKHRAVLDEYSVPFLDQMIIVVSAVTVVCYSIYAIDSDNAHRHPYLWATVPIVFYSVCRYLYLVYQKGWGGAPDEVLMKDRNLQAAILCWLGVVLLLFGVDR